MTAPNASDYRIPADWQHFERLCIALMSCVYKKRFQQYGRGGQRQDGVDAYCTLSDGTLIAIQCKGRSQGYGSRLSPGDISDAVSKTATFPHRIDHLLILTTGPNDRALEDRALEITNRHLQQGRYQVEVWGWQSLQNIIREHESIQRAFYNDRISARQWIVRAGVLCLLIVGGIICMHQYWARHDELTSQRKLTSKDVVGFVKLSDRLGHAYSKCLKKMNESSFIFSYEFEQFCTLSIASQLEAIEGHVQRVSLDIDARAFDNMSTMLTLLREDYRQGLIAVEMTRHFEQGVIRSQKALCPPGTSNDPVAVLKDLRVSAEAAQTQQLEFYFVLRDFILPGLESMKSQVLASARQINNQPIPESMVKQANHLSELLEERHGYQVNVSKKPFTLSVVKALSSRSITMSGPESEDVVEDARWEQVFLNSISSSLYGNHKDVQELVDCGIFRPGAIGMIEKEEDEIRKAAGLN